MHVKLPAVLGVDAKSRLGRVRQIAVLPTTFDCSTVKYTLGKSVGHVLQNTAGANLLYLFPIRPKTTPLPTGPSRVAGAKSISHRAGAVAAWTGSALGDRQFVQLKLADGSIVVGKFRVR